MPTIHLGLKTEEQEEKGQFDALVELAKAPGHSGVVRLRHLYIKVEYSAEKGAWSQRILSAQEIAQLNQQ